MSPLNPRLFGLLTRLFGIVAIVSAGLKRVVLRSPNGRHDVRQGGEEYRLNCPSCNDRRKRCYVNHMQGQYDPLMSRVHRYLFCCHNCAFQKQPVARDRFADQIALPLGTRLAGNQPQAIAEEATIRSTYELPEGRVPITSPDAQVAAGYLESRGFNTSELSRIWDVQYCPSYSLLGTAAFRMVIPIYQPTKWFCAAAKEPEAYLAGWQARDVGLLPEDVPKYIFPSGMQKSRLLYGLPQALAAPGPVVVCEGMTDAWRVGPGAVALFGKTLSDQQLKLLCHYFVGRPIVVLLDTDAADDAKKIAEQLVAARGRGFMALATLPSGYKDPGGTPLDLVMQAIAAALGKMRHEC